MSMRIGDIAPDFEAQSTEGTVRLHDWIGDSRAVLLSHPKDLTPVCTTDLGYMAGRGFDEVLRVIDSLQLTAKHKVATPVNWHPGEDVIIAGSVSDEQAKEIFGEWESPRPHIRIVPQPEKERAGALS